MVDFYFLIVRIHFRIVNFVSGARINFRINLVFLDGPYLFLVNKFCFGWFVFIGGLFIFF